MDEFANDMAGQRLESVEDQFEDFFDVNGEDDVDDDDMVGGAQNKREKDLDYYSRRDSKTSPNMRTQSMADKVNEEEFLEKKLKPALQELIENIKIEERSKTS